VSKFGRFYTNEEPPRKLVILGRSGISPDVLVAHDPDKEGEVLWIVENGDTKATNFFVCHKPYRAVRMPEIGAKP